MPGIEPGLCGWKPQILPLDDTGVKNQGVKGMLWGKQYCYRQSGNPRTSDLQVSPPGGFEPPSVRSEAESASAAPRWLDFYIRVNLIN